MKEETKEFLKHQIPVWICASVALILSVVGFIIPPMGVIDGSVLQAAGEIIGIIALLEIPHCLSIGKDISIKHNNTELNINGSDNKEEQQAKQDK